MKHFIKEYFTFNKRERNGIFVLLTIILLLILCLTFSDYFIPKKEIDFTAFEKDIDAFQAAQKETINDSIDEQEHHYAENEYKIASPTEAERFDFNPNNLPENDWKRLGLSDKQIRIIKNYESKGGKFYKKEDLKKIYGISETLYNSLLPFIQIPQKQREEAFETKNETAVAINNFYEKKNLMIELNSADSTELTQLKGIGPVLSGRILKYRKRLGGFVAKEQLMEVYGIDSLLYASIKGKAVVDENKIVKYNINQVSIEELKKHPYIKYSIANSIVNYRNRHGSYKELAEILKSDLVNEELYRKIAPYLTTE